MLETVYDIDVPRLAPADRCSIWPHFERTTIVAFLIAVPLSCRCHAVLLLYGLDPGNMSNGVIATKEGNEPF